MTMRLTRWRSIGRTLWAGGWLFLCGCSLDPSGLLSNHLSDKRKAEAQQRWDSVRSDVKLQLAEQHLAAGRLDEAEKVLEQAVGLAPGNPQAYVLAARLRLEQGQLALAREAITHAAAMSPADPEIEYLHGMIAERYGDLPAALEHYASAADYAPNISAYLLARVEALIALDRPAEALAILQSRIDDFDGDAAVRMLAARTAQMIGLRAPAAEQCREALRGHDDDPALSVEVGLMLVWAEEYQEAIGLLRPPVEEYCAAGSADEPSALASAQQTRGPARSGTGVISGKDAPAQKAAPSPVTPAVVHALARAYLATGEWRQAQWAAKIRMSQDAQDVTAWTLYARAALMGGDMESAAAVLAAVRQNNVATPETLLLTAYVALQRGDRAAAVEAAEAALRMDKDLAPARRLLERATAVASPAVSEQSLHGEGDGEAP